MRFNSKELAQVAHLSNQNFDKEGILFLKEKQEGLFKKGEVYSKKLFRLRGNLLFYFKTCDQNSEVSGLFVLERCLVELDNDATHPYCFILIFEGDDKVVHLSAGSEEERDGWIESLHIASYECLQMQLRSLREQIKARTGKDPIDSPEPSSLPEYNSGSVFDTEEPFLEMGLACENLPAEILGKEPDTFASIHFMTPPHQQWIPHAHTEIVEKSCMPHYLTAIGFSNPQIITKSTRLKIVVYNVKERMTNTMTQLGTVMFSLSDIMETEDKTLQLKLSESHGSGQITVMAWENDSGILQINGAVSGQSRASYNNLHTGCVRTAKTKTMNMLKPLYENIINKSFRFPTNSGLLLSVHEYMGESKHTFSLPKELLKLWVEEEKQRIEILQALGQAELAAIPLIHSATVSATSMVNFYTRAIDHMTKIEGLPSGIHSPITMSSVGSGQSTRVFSKSTPVSNSITALNGPRNLMLDPEMSELRKDVIDFHMSTTAMYDQHASFLASYEGDCYGSPFKPSTKKGQKELEFAPTNLHIQRMWVSDNYHPKTFCYDMITVGAFTAYCQKYKHGGLRRLIRQLTDNITDTQQDSNILDTINQLMNNITLLRAGVEKCAGQVCHAANQGEGAELQNAVHALADKTRQLISICENSLVEEGSVELAKSRSQACLVKRPISDNTHLSTGSSVKKKSPDKSWKWSGTDFVKSPTEEPFDLTRLNTEAAVMCVISQAESLTSSQETSTQWLEDLSPLVIKLQKCVEVMCLRAKSCLTFLTLHVCGPHVGLLHSIKYRRDVVFAQALTSVVAAFMTYLRRCVPDEEFLRQLVKIGILIQFESLLTCHGDESGMLEDFAVGVADMGHVMFKLKKARNCDDIIPTVEGNRPGYTVHIPLDEGLFTLLPRELQRGHTIKITPVLFSIGINEQASLAERFGNLTVQDEVNAEGLKTLHEYVVKYTEILGVEASHTKQLMYQLSVNVNSKKAKNIEVLHLSREICRHLKGLRFTSCKSAKDRTAMGVTLEQVQILQKEHDLAAHVFTHAMECMRSEGVRRENTVKNTGIRKYAFNSIQLMSFPKLYRPPKGTYGMADS